jgi:hypothetical protein
MAIAARRNILAQSGVGKLCRVARRGARPQQPLVLSLEAARVQDWLAIAKTRVYIATLGSKQSSIPAFSALVLPTKFANVITRQAII